LLTAPVLAHAQDQAPASSSADNRLRFGGSQPIEISTDNGIEWTATARPVPPRGNAVATQGSSEVHATTLVATYNGSSNQSPCPCGRRRKIMKPRRKPPMAIAPTDQTRRLLVMTGTGI